MLYIIAEGATGLSQRVAAWWTERPEGGGGLVPPAACRSPDDKDLSAVRQVATRHKPVMIVFDTQAKVAVGLDENSSKDMGEFVNRLEWLLEEAGGRARCPPPAPQR